ncbi:MAG: AsmA family protein [Gammaproteobacteria bacterium]|nr:AsmA family protein [Gammaproteobacteria bacterium]
MKSLLKWILWLVASLLLLLGIVIGAAFFIFDSDALKSQLISAVKEETSADLTIEDDLALSFFPWLKIETGNIRLSNPEGFQSKVDLLSVEKLNASIKLMPIFEGVIEIGAVELANSKLNLIRDRKGRSNIDVLMTNAQKSKKTNESEETTKDTALSISRLALDNFELNQYAPNQKLTQSFALQNFEVNDFSFEQWTPISARGDFKSGSGKTQANWSLKSDIKVSTDGKAIDLRSVDAVMSEISNKLKHLELTGDSSIKLNNKNTQVSHKGQLKLDKQTFELGLNGVFSTFKDLELDLKTQDLDLSPWLATATVDTGSKSAAPLDTKPIADFLKTARIKGKFSANSVKLKQMNFEQVSADLSNKGATLWLKPFKAKAFQGDLATNASINFAAKPLALSLAPSLQKIEVGDLISQVFEVDRLSGLGSINLNLTTQGLELKQMLQNLSGTGSLQLSDGALSGLDLNKLIESGISLQSLKGKDAYKGKTTFAGLTGDINANKGLIQLNNMSLVTPLFDLAGKAATDANQESLSGNFQLILKGVLKQQLEQKYPQLAGMALPLELKGTWNEPRPNIDFEALLKAKYKSKVDNQVKEKKKELEDELKKKLLDKIKFD